jgi:hypothetical protein
MVLIEEQYDLYRETCNLCGGKINSDSASLKTEIRGQYRTGGKQTVMM